MAPAFGRTVYFGTFVHSISLAELEITHNAAVFVDENGRIAAIERGLPNVFAASEVMLRLGWAGTTGSVEHVEHVEDVRDLHGTHFDGHQEVLEHVGNGVHAISSGVTNGIHAENGASTVIMGDVVSKRRDVKLVVCKEEEFFFPGFIDTHIHASQYPNAGIFGKTTLMSWLEKYTFPTEASLASLSIAKRIYNRVIARTLSHGTTTAAYFATIDVAPTNLLADLCLEKGQRAFVGRVCMDRMSPDYYRDESAQQSIQKTEECIHHVRSIDPKFALVSPIITPRFGPTCTSEVLMGLGKLQKETNLPVQTHLSENHNEIQLVAELFPTSKDYTDVYDTHGLLGPKTILAHCIHLSDSEREVIKAREAKISHCPTSNSSITSGTARVRWLLDAGIDVGLGTDMSGGYSPSLLEAARHALLVSRHVAMAQTSEAETEHVKLSVEEVLYLATRGGAKVVGLENKIGGFGVGMEWDAQLIGLDTVPADGEMEGGREGPVDVFGWESWEDKVAKWVFGGDERNTKKVWVKGRMVHERRD